MKIEMQGLTFMADTKSKRLVDPEKTRQVQRKYDRNAVFFDLMERFEGGRFSTWRKELWSQAAGEVLEVGIGTGINFQYYPPGVHVTGIDVSEGMLHRARVKARKLGLKVNLLAMDVQKMTFPDHTFDTVVSTCVFCTVPDPILGLEEIRRVVKPAGKVLFLEHVRSNRPVLGKLMDLANPLVAALIGTNINRRTAENIIRAGLEIVEIKPLWLDIVYAIRARPRPEAKP